jgi:hypothetical protein
VLRIRVKINTTIMWLNEETQVSCWGSVYSIQNSRAWGGTLLDSTPVDWSAPHTARSNFLTIFHTCLLIVFAEVYSLVDIGAGVGQFGRWLLDKARNICCRTSNRLESVSQESNNCNCSNNDNFPLMIYL